MKMSDFALQFTDAVPEVLDKSRRGRRGLRVRPVGVVDARDTG